MSDYTRTTNYSLYKPVPGEDDDVWGDHWNANADTLDGIIRQIDQRGSGGGVLLVTDYLPPGQPDGVTDNTPYLQDAINAAAGHGTVRFLANSNAYIAGSLFIPSNSHVVIDAGATLRLPPNTTGGMLGISDSPPSPSGPYIGASNVYIEQRGTLDGNASNQTVDPLHPSAGIVNLGVSSDLYIDGFRQGLITNFLNWPVNITRCTNAEVRNLAMTNSGNSCEFAGVVVAGTTVKCYNVGFVNCYVQDIRDIGLTLYGGCESSYIRGCDLNNASALIYLDNGQPGVNVDCEISGCYRYNGLGAIGTASNNTSGVRNLNCRIFNNTVENVHDGGLTIGSVDYCEVYGNLVHDTGVNFSSASGQNGMASIADASHVNFYGNTIRNPTVPGYYSPRTATSIASTPPATYNPTTGAISLTTSAAHLISVGGQFVLNSAFGSGDCHFLNGTWTATAGTSGTTLNFTGPLNLTLTLKSGNILKYAPATAATITSGTYDPSTGNVVLTTSAPHGLTFSAIPQPFVVSGISGTGAVANLNGYQVATTGTSGMTINFTTSTGFAATTITGGTILPANFGLSVYTTDYCRIINNFIGDWQTTKMMAACIGGQWGTDGYTEGNIYGPKLATAPLYGFSADAMVYVPGSGNTQGVNYDTAIDFYSGTTAGRNIAGQTFFPNRGLTVGWNLNSGVGEIDLLCGRSTGAPGGFNFWQIHNDGTINANVGVAGSLLANDGLGNTRLGGALVHGAVQTATLASGGTVTVNANTSFVLVNNASSIATGSVVLPAPSAIGSFTGTGNELEIRFQNAVGTLTMTAATGASVSGQPTTVATAGTSFAFIQSGTAWLRRIPA